MITRHAITLLLLGTVVSFAEKDELGPLEQRGQLRRNPHSG